MFTKRIFDLLLSFLGLAILSPVFFVLAGWIRLDSSGPVFFRQERVGQFGRMFRIHKFRTMTMDAERQNLQLTVGADSRITRAGRLLRHYKLDELPQLIDVFLGNMSLVGPRPEVPKYVAYWPDDVKTIVLSVPPGITDYAAIEFRDESAILAGSANPERAYVEKILPQKLECYRQYVVERSIMLDIKLIFRTIRAIMGHN